MMSIKQTIKDEIHPLTIRHHINPSKRVECPRRFKGDDVGSAEVVLAGDSDMNFPKVGEKFPQGRGKISPRKGKREKFPQGRGKGKTAGKTLFFFFPMQILSMPSFTSLCPLQLVCHRFQWLTGWCNCCPPPRVVEH